jgi:hypothetical protein
MARKYPVNYLLGTELGVLFGMTFNFFVFHPHMSPILYRVIAIMCLCLFNGWLWFTDRVR